MDFNNTEQNHSEYQPPPLLLLCWDHLAAPAKANRVGDFKDATMLMRKLSFCKQNEVVLIFLILYLSDV